MPNLTDENIDGLTNMARALMFGEQSVLLLKAMLELKELREEKRLRNRSPKEVRLDR